MKRIQRILVANRGEIAARIMRTCRGMGIATVAVFSDADERAPHVDAADEAVRIGPPEASQSYLDIDKILAAAELTGADAIHPGYGFLAENAAFAQACADRGVVFIGPGPDVIRLLGSKRESKRVVGAAGVPVIPGYDGGSQDDDELAARAREIGFPVLLKASAGGGGKGMRVVASGDDLAEALASARREAASAFGDDTMLIEKYIDRPRHIEFQILGDDSGQVIHLFERECSIQRRHQKIIEETPSPAMTDALREAMGRAAVTVGEAVGYRNAGTVEFILAPDGQFYFLEVNTRLQVEHPVTECVTGLDLVREQIRVAQGATIDQVRSCRAMSGAAIECRLYAEDPDNGFLPTTGRIADWHVPDMPGLRVDAGIRAGLDVSIYYDPMLAKIICHAPTRAEAIQKMIYGLRALGIAGVVTNRDYLLRVLDHPAFLRGEFDTHFIDAHSGDLAPPLVAPALLRRAVIAAVLAGHERRRETRAILPALEPGFRNNRFADEQVTYSVGDRTVVAGYRNLGAGRFAIQTTISGDDSGDEVQSGTVILHCWDEPGLIFEEDGGGRHRVRVIIEGEARFHVHALAGSVTAIEAPRFPDASGDAPTGSLVAPMPGKIVKVLVSEGQAVTAGDTLMVVEAMKMEHAIKAPEDGVVSQLASEGEQVDTDAVLAVITSA